MLRLSLLAAAALSSCSLHQVDLSVQAPPTLASEPVPFETAHVTHVIDGDTIEVEMSGRRHNVRLIGIDTPESVDPDSPVECFGKEASAAAAALLQDQDVRLVKDVENVDAYDRLLRYVYLGDEMANARLVINGYAHAYTYPPSVRHSELFVQLEREAKAAGRGLWSHETCSGRG